MNNLDARVTALLHMVDAYVADLSVAKFKAFQSALRTELQKPALHEPVTDAEITHAIGVYLENRRVPYLRGVSPYTADIKAVLESFLQGRAKPAQEEITDAEPIAKAIYEQWVDKPGYVQWEAHGNSIMQDKARDIARECIRASKGEKT